MNIVFFGSDNFAVRSLEALRASDNRVLCAVTQPDKKSGRGMNISSTPVAAAARALGITLFQPADVNAQESLEFLKRQGAGLFVIVAYGQIVSDKLLLIPEKFSINAHASLLPKYRGASPINRAIINGETQTGVTIIKITGELDAGPVLLQRKIDIEQSDTSVSLEDKLSKLAASLLLEAIEDIKNDNYRLIEQNGAAATYAPKLKKSDGLVNWKMPAGNIHDLVRGCMGWPGAFSHFRGKTLKIFRSKAEASPKRPGKPGEIIEAGKHGIVVACGEGSLAIEELQLEAKKRMNAADFVAGSRIAAGEVFEGP